MIINRKNFIHPRDKKVHTQGVDGLASHIKTNIRNKRGIPVSSTQGHLAFLSLLNLAKRKGNLIDCLIIIVIIIIISK